MLPSAGARLFSAAAGASAALQVCVVGSGPAGLYTAEKLLKRYGDGVRVDVLDRLPTPFGLVRSGVAPDHADTKNVINQFTATCSDPRVGYFGNVRVGADVTLGELRSLYHAVVLAYGAESDRPLNIPGEASAGVFAAREFVWWYNAHPDAQALPVDLSKVESVAICGIGNVALDCARLLLRRPAELATTDIAAHTMAQLARTSRVREVHLFARRGPVQAACTPKELKELVNLKGLAVHAPADQMVVSPDDEAQMKAVRMRRRMYDLITQAAAKQPADAGHHLRFQFYRSPAEALADASGAVSGLRVERTRLEASGPGGAVVAVGTGECETHPVQLVLKSIGYKSLPLEGVAFDARGGVIPNAAGRVLKEKGGAEVDPGLYVCGWVKRGPTGLIGTNAMDADETVDSMLRDTPGAPAAPAPGAAGLRALLASRGVAAVDFDGWRRIDAEEVRRGAAEGKPREKVVAVPEMVAVAEARRAAAAWPALGKVL